MIIADRCSWLPIRISKLLAAKGLWTCRKKTFVFFQVNYSKIITLFFAISSRCSSTYFFISFSLMYVVVSGLYFWVLNRRKLVSDCSEKVYTKSILVLSLVFEICLPLQNKFLPSYKTVGTMTKTNLSITNLLVWYLYLRNFNMRPNSVNTRAK